MEIEKNKQESSKIVKSDKTQDRLIKNLKYNQKNDDDLVFWKDKGFEKVPNGEDFAKGGFQRNEVLVLIDVIKKIFEIEKDGRFKIQYGEIVNHFVRNGSNSTLTGEYNKKKLVYDGFVYFINLIRKLDENQKLLFLDKLKSMHLQNIKYPEGSNRIEVMIGEIENNQSYDN